MNGDRLGLTDLVEVRDLLFRTQAMRFRVAGWSMYPTLWPGDRLTAELVGPEQLQVGDLLLIHHRGRVICHRLLSVQETGAEPWLVTRGDGQDGCGDVTRADQVLGRVVAVSPRWPWARRIRWAGLLAVWIDLARERVTHLIAQGLQYLQGLRGYRWIMRSILLPCVDFYCGVSEGTRWFRYEPISRSGDDPIVFTGSRDFRLLAKLGGTCVGSLQGKAVADGYRIENLYVRIRCCGMGVGSKLLALTATAASRSGPAVLLASVDAANTVALDAFRKAGFRQVAGRDGNAVCLRRDLHGRAGGS